MGAILAQKDEKGREKVICYASRATKEREAQLGSTMGELCAVVLGILHYELYLRGQRFMVYTDHATLAWLRSARQLTGKLYRWQVILEQFDFEVLYKPGTNHQNTDALSRMPQSGGPDALEDAGDLPGFMQQEEEVVQMRRSFFMRGVERLRLATTSCRDPADPLPIEQIPYVIDRIRLDDEVGRQWGRDLAVIEFPEQACLVTDEELSF